MSSKEFSEKKKWEKPELTVLVRHKPEEAVLSGCKTYSNGAASGVNYQACVNSTGACIACSFQFGS